jgi:hypothetical protein
MVLIAWEGADPASMSRPWRGLRTRPSENRGLPGIATGSPRSLVGPRSSLQLSRDERSERRNGATGALPGERRRLRRVGGVLFEPVAKVARGYLTPWLDSSQVRRVHGGGADGAGPARLLGRWDHYPERTDRLGRSEGVTFAGAQVGTGERRTEGLVRSDTGGLLIQGGS